GLSIICLQPAGYRTLRGEETRMEDRGWKMAQDGALAIFHPPFSILVFPDYGDATSPAASFNSKSALRLARSIRLCSRTYSCSLCRSPPTGPRESTTGMPAAASLFPSHVPPLARTDRTIPSSLP